PEIKAIVDSCFDAFIVRNLMLLPGYDTLPIGFCGSIAANFTPILEAALARHGLKASRIEASPMPGLIKYHTCKKN
ncbi:MAG: ATPase, partial [Paramuribaculum sp.]|nr:ATPase [Paramuribaculum sp.]